VSSSGNRAGSLALNFVQLDSCHATSVNCLDVPAYLGETSASSAVKGCSFFVV
jgi:hypothetical protein